MQLAHLLYDRMTVLDIVGPYEVFHTVPDFECVFVAERRGPVRNGRGSLTLVADKTLGEVSRPDIVVVPGGIGARLLLEHEPLLSWLRQVHETTILTTSVCTGALLLAAAGLLEAAPATTHWTDRNLLASLGAQPVSARVVQHGKIFTAAGVSAGIDMALRVVQQLHGDQAAQAAQLELEYDPQPPFDSGSPEKAPAAIVTAVAAASEAYEARVLRESGLTAQPRVLCGSGYQHSLPQVTGPRRVHPLGDP